MITLKGSSGIYEGPTIEEMYTDGIEVNTKFHELNTDKYYYYDGSDWVEIPGGGGGGGGFVPTEDQLAAMNSGATTEKINQIDTNKNNISSFHKASGTDIYFQEDEPTGTIVQGSYWISRSGNKKYETSPNLSNGVFSQGGIYDNGGLNVLTNFVRISVPVTAGQTYSFSSNKLIRTVYGYQGRWDLPTSKTLILSDDTPSESTYTFTVPDNMDNVGISLCNADSSAIVPSDVQNFMFNAGDTALPYEPYGVIWH